MTEQKLLNRLLNSFTFDSQGFKTLAYHQDFIMQGKAFTVAQELSIPSGKNYLLFKAGEKGAVITPATFTTDSSPVTIKLFLSSNYESSNVITSFNRNTTSSLTPQSSFNLGATGTEVGDNISSYPIFGSGVGANTSGGSASTGLVFVLGSNETMLFEVDNKTNPATTISSGVAITWYEIT